MDPKGGVEPEQQKTKMKPRGWGSLTEPEGRGAGWLMLDQGGAGATREPDGASGLPGHGGADGSMGRSGVWD